MAVKIRIRTRQPGAAAEARLILGVQDWEGVGRGQSAPPPRWGWPGSGGWFDGFEGFVLVGTAALFREGMDEWLATEVLRADGLLTRSILTMEWEVLWK